MDAPSARARHWRGVSAPVPVLSLARMGRAAVACAAVDDFRAGRAARGGRLVDGRLRPGEPGRRLTIPAWDAPRARLRDLRGNRLDLAESRRTAGPAGADAAAR